jgi:hypothetical protein
MTSARDLSALLRRAVVRDRELGKHPPDAPDGLILQVGRPGHRPWLSANDRCEPMLRARRGHGLRRRSWLGPESDGHQLDRRVRPVPADHLPRWQESGGLVAARVGRLESAASVGGEERRHLGRDRAELLSSGWILE